LEERLLDSRFKQSWRRQINQRTPIISTLTGLLIIYSSFLLLKGGSLTVFVVTIGLIFLEAGLWYGANPILTSERRYFGLRDEVNRFINLVRQLNSAVVNRAGDAEVERVKTAMHESVEQMSLLAGQAYATSHAPSPSAEYSEKQSG
jgi:hypothetical protein